MDRVVDKLPLPPKSPWASLPEALAEAERAALVALDRWTYAPTVGSEAPTVRPGSK